MQTRTPDEIAEALAIQKMTVERIIIREANRLQDRLNGVTTYNTAEEFLASLDDGQEHHLEPTC